MRDAFFPLDEEKIINIESNAESNEVIQKTKSRRHSIPQDVKDKVWNRDGGKCVECGTATSKHIFKHSSVITCIIPFSQFLKFETLDWNPSK